MEFKLEKLVNRPTVLNQDDYIKSLESYIDNTVKHLNRIVDTSRSARITDIMDCEASLVIEGHAVMALEGLK